MMFQKMVRAKNANVRGLFDLLSRSSSLNKQLTQEITRPKVARSVPAEL
jgi:hypothetical protein